MILGSTIRTRSQKNISHTSQYSYSNILSHGTKTSKVSEKANSYDLYPKNFNHALLSKTDFELHGNNSKMEFEECQDNIGEKLYQKPGHPTTFMKMV
jgi:hypothetical protein